MIEITIKKEDIDRIVAKVKKLRPEQRNPVFRNAWERATLFMEGRLKYNVSGPILKVRSGQLRNSIQSKIDYQNGKIRSIIGSGARTGKRVPYANIHETGGIIRPRNAKALAIPFPFAQAKSGAGNVSARGLFKQYPGRVFIAKGVIWLQRGKTDKSIVPMFSLVQSVKIPARHYISRTVSQYGGNVVKIVERWIDQTIKGK